MSKGIVRIDLNDASDGRSRSVVYMCQYRYNNRGIVMDTELRRDRRVIAEQIDKKKRFHLDPGDTPRNAAAAILSDKVRKTFHRWRRNRTPVIGALNVNEGEYFLFAHLDPTTTGQRSLTAHWRFGLDGATPINEGVLTTTMGQVNEDDTPITLTVRLFGVVLRTRFAEFALFDEVGQ